MNARIVLLAPLLAALTADDPLPSPLDLSGLLAALGAGPVATAAPAAPVLLKAPIDPWPSSSRAPLRCEFGRAWHPGRAAVCLDGWRNPLDGNGP
jgi:hypothetical protein